MIKRDKLAMRSVSALVFALTLVLTVGCRGSHDRALGHTVGVTTASATLKPTQGHQIYGTVMFERSDTGAVQVVANVSGLAPSSAHGFHIHENGDCSAADASSAGGHFNPGGNEHGSPTGARNHAGDLGNLRADSDGTALKTITVNHLSLTGGKRAVLGKAVIVHAGADDLTSQPSGAAGARIACGVIGGER